MQSISTLGTAALCVLISMTTLAANTRQSHVVRDLPHLDLEMTGYEYRRLLHSHQQKGLMVLQIGEVEKDAEDIAIDTYVKYGERNLQWLDLINKTRPAGQKISLTSEATAHGNSIANPRVLNLAEIDGEWFVIRSLVPDAIKKIIFNGEEMPSVLPVSEREFIEWCRQIDDAYQNSARLQMLKPWRSELAEIAKYDVRGFLKIRDDINVNAKLNDWADLREPQRIALSDALVLICKNAEVPDADCRKELAAASAANSVLAFKEKYMLAALALYNSFFEITKFRTDVTWTSAQPNTFTVPFTNPNNSTVMDFLRLNIEDEYQWKDWQLHLNFVEIEDPGMTHVLFEAGSTPHVDDLAGSEITMDANAPLSEYDVQWTIRHEYGHVLGFPDCYFEFYDEPLDAFVSYQLDITNLMCSRRGHLQQRHFDELKRVYFK